MVKASVGFVLPVVALVMGAIASGFAVPSAWAAIQPEEEVVMPSAATPSELTLRDGIYLYGETDQPDQLGVTYTVFELKNRRVTGAVYTPHSSFDCFHGTLREGELALTVVDSYTRTSYPHAIALTIDTAIATQGIAMGSVEVGLLGMNRMPEVSANDRRLLAVCQANL